MEKANIYSYGLTKQLPRVKQNKHLCSINHFYKEHSSWKYDYQLWSSVTGWEQNLTRKRLSRMAESLLFSGLFLAMNTSREHILYSWHPLLLHLWNTCVLTIQNVPAVMRPSRQMTLWSLLCVSKIMFKGKVPDSQRGMVCYIFTVTPWIGLGTKFVLILTWNGSRKALFFLICRKTCGHILPLFR